MIGRTTFSMLVVCALVLASLDARADPNDIVLVSSASSTLASGTTQSFSIDPGTGTDVVLLIGSSYSSGAEGITGITFGGLVARLVETFGSSGALSVDVWEVDNPPSGSGTVTIKYNATVSAVAGAIALSNAATHPGAAGGNGGAGKTSEKPLETGDDRDVVVDFLAVSSAATATAGSQTPKWNTTAGTVRGASSVEPGDADTAGKWTFSSSQQYADVSLDVSPANAPTAIVTHMLDASDSSYGTLIRWRASTLGNTLGYRVYREEPGQPGGHGQRLTRELIAGAALSGPEGGSSMGTRDYAWHDREAHSKQAMYWVEEVDLSGRHRWTGPVTATTGPATAAGVADSPTLSQQASATGQAAAPMSSSVDASVPAPIALQHPVFRPADVADPGPNEKCEDLASRPAVKIRVEQEGMYTVPWADLAGAGLDGPDDLQRLHLYADGLEHPLRVVPASATGAASIEFYGIGHDTLWSGARTYWLTLGGSGGRQLALPAVPPGVPAGASANPPNSFAYTLERRDHTEYVAALKIADGNNFFGAVVNTAGASQSLTVTNHDPSDGAPATLDVTLQGATAAAHSVTVLFNGQTAGTIPFTGEAVGTGTFSIPSGRILEGTNTLTLQATGDDTDVSLLVSTRLTYQHRYVADGDALFLPSPRSGTIRIGGFTTEHVRLLDVTDPNDAKEIAARVVPDANTFTLVMASPLPAGRRLYAFADTQVLAPGSVRANHPSTWHLSGARAELVMVTDSSLRKSVEPLAALRRSQGWSVATVNVEDLYDEYNCGEKNPGAIKAFLDQSHGSSSPAARYVLLDGDASFDPRNYLDLGDHDHVSTKLQSTSTIQTASDDWFGDFDNDGVPDIGVGRIPAATEAQSDAVVQKLLTYPTQYGASPATGGAWTSVGLFIADENNGYDFEAEARRAEMTLPSGIRPQEFFRSAQNPATAEADLVDRLNAGAALVNYVGHGSVQIWDGTLQTTDVSTLTNGSKLPVFVNMTCLNGLFQDPRIESLGASLLLATNGGAVAVWGSSTSPDAAVEDTGNAVFIRSLSQGALGDAVIQAKTAVTDSDFRIGEVLLGDPSLFGTPARPESASRTVGPVSETIDVESVAYKIPGSSTGGSASSSSCSIAACPGGRTALPLFFLASIGALFGRRRRLRDRSDGRVHHRQEETAGAAPAERVGARTSFIVTRRFHQSLHLQRVAFLGEQGVREKTAMSLETFETSPRIPLRDRRARLVQDDPLRRELRGVTPRRGRAGCDRLDCRSRRLHHGARFIQR